MADLRPGVYAASAGEGKTSLGVLSAVSMGPFAPKEQAPRFMFATTFLPRGVAGQHWVATLVPVGEDELGRARFEAGALHVVRAGSRDLLEYGSDSSAPRRRWTYHSDLNGGNPSLRDLLVLPDIEAESTSFQKAASDPLAGSGSADSSAAQRLVDACVQYYGKLPTAAVERRNAILGLYTMETPLRRGLDQSSLRDDPTGFSYYAAYARELLDLFRTGRPEGWPGEPFEGVAYRWVVVEDPNESLRHFAVGERRHWRALTSMSTSKYEVLDSSLPAIVLEIRCPSASLGEYMPLRLPPGPDRGEEVLFPPGVAFQVVEVAPYAAFGGRPLVRCEVVEVAGDRASSSTAQWLDSAAAGSGAAATADRGGSAAEGEFTLRRPRAPRAEAEGVAGGARASGEAGRSERRRLTPPRLPASAGHDADKDQGYGYRPSCLEEIWYRGCTPLQVAVAVALLCALFALLFSVSGQTRAESLPVGLGHVLHSQTSLYVVAAIMAFSVLVGVLWHVYQHTRSNALRQSPYYALASLSSSGYTTSASVPAMPLDCNAHRGPIVDEAMRMQWAAGSDALEAVRGLDVDVSRRMDRILDKAAQRASGTMEGHEPARARGFVGPALAAPAPFPPPAGQPFAARGRSPDSAADVSGAAPLRGFPTAASTATLLPRAYAPGFPLPAH